MKLSALVSPTNSLASVDDKSILRAEGLWVQLGHFWILQNLDIHIQQGEWLGLVGANGAGKSTLLNVLAGSVRAQQGRIVFKGQELGRLSPAQRQRLGLARSFQRSQLFGALTVREHFALVRPLGQRQALAQSDIEQLLSAWGLAAQADRASTLLSYPLQRLLDLALALAGEPHLLLLDEPCAGLGPQERETMLQQVLAHHQRGCAILMVEHDHAWLARYAQRILCLQQGHALPY